jgi:hypothetical protein
LNLRKVAAGGKVGSWWLRQQHRRTGGLQLLLLKEGLSICCYIYMTCQTWWKQSELRPSLLISHTKLGIKPLSCGTAVARANIKVVADSKTWRDAVLMCQSFHRL